MTRKGGFSSFFLFGETKEIRAKKPLKTTTIKEGKKDGKREIKRARNKNKGTEINKKANTIEKKRRNKPANKQTSK